MKKSLTVLGHKSILSRLAAVCFIFLALAILFLFSSPFQYSPANSDSTESHNNDLVTGECDMFTGSWVQVDSSNTPAYTNETCPFIEDHQDCIKNGRPDSNYLFWRWKPQDCDIPRFNPTRFLNLMRNRSWGFIGDSISRNHVQSLLCTLSQVDRADETYHDKDYRSKKWHFPMHNFSLSVIWSPFLLKASIFEDANGFSTNTIQLHLDKLDESWTEQFNDFDYVVIAGGKWFLKTAVYYENDVISGCHYCPGMNLTELGFEHAYRKALQLIFEFMANGKGNVVLFRTTTPDHFENGEWFSGGYCNRTVPFSGIEVDLKGVDEIMREIELVEYGKAIEGDIGGGSIKLLDTTRMLLLRPDGHPGPYRQFQPFSSDKNVKVQRDCLHWCLPGPMDSINGLLMEMILKHLHSLG